MLKPEQQTFYRENGYLLVKGLLSREEAEDYRRESHELIARLSAIRDTDATWGSARQANAMTDGKAGVMTGAMTATVLHHSHDVQFHSAAFSRLIVDERLTSAVSQLMGSPNVQLHHNKMFVKPPAKGSPFPMHQDHPFFPHERHSMMAAIIHFDDAPLEKGCVRVVPGSHKLGPIEHVAEGGWHLPFDQYPLESAVACPAEAGDVLLFNYLTIHGSGVNTSNEARTTLLVQMRDPSDPPSNEEHRSRCQGMMLRGIDPLQVDQLTH
ncbi:MAG: phytanoyl-CoA dioxygenase family protein [Trueperaceae bacterium]